MCSLCAAKAAALQQQKPYLFNTLGCEPIEYYQTILDNLVPNTSEKILLKSLLKSQINIYTRDCKMFEDNIKDIVSRI